MKEKKRFTKSDMKRFARFVLEGRHTEHWLESYFRSWYQGPGYVRRLPRDLQTQ